jgi:hypothetical protein
MIAANRVNPRLALFVALLLTALPAPTAAASFSELIKRGFEMLQSQRFEEAVENFGGALAAEPASEPARKGLAAAWAAIGVSHQRAGRLRQSRDALERDPKVRSTTCCWRRSSFARAICAPRAARRIGSWSSRRRARRRGSFRETSTAGRDS